MQVIKDELALDTIDDPLLHELIESRIADMTQGEDFDPDLHGFFVVMEAGDSVAEIEAVFGTSLLHNGVTSAKYGGPDFSPLFEYVGAHAGWYEIVVVPGDGDFGIVLFVARHATIEPRLLALCAEYAVAEPSEV
jgi:hypothetical protein